MLMSAPYKRLVTPFARHPFVAGCIVAAVATLAVASSLVHDDHQAHNEASGRTSTLVTSTQQSAQDGGLPRIPEGQVCRYDGKQLDPANWMDESPSPVGTPSSELASSGNIESVWVCAGTDTVLVYPHLTVTFEPGWSKDDQTANWTAMVEDWGTGSVKTVDGYPAYVAGPSEMTPKGELLFAVDGNLVRIIGDGTLSAEDLTTVGNSIKISQAVLQSKG
jgi:hypothetical protein